MFPAQTAVRISFDTNFTEVRPPGVKVKQTIRERTTDTKDQLQRLRRLNRPDDPRQGSDHAGFLAGCDQAGGRGGFEDASVAGGLPWDDGRHAAVKAQNASMDER